MRQSRLVWQIVGWLADLAALGLAWWATLAAFFEPHHIFRVTSPLVYMVAIPAVNACWLQIRLAPRVSRLAHKARREELALTPIRPGDYLLPRLKWHFVRALLPMATTLPFQAIGLWVNEGWDFEVSMGIVTVGVWVALSMCLAVLGVFDMLVRLCRSGRGGEAVLLIPSAWAVVSVGAPAGLLCLWCSFVYVATKRRYDSLDDLTFFLMIGLGLALLVAAVVFTVRRWRRACASYYYFG